MTERPATEMYSQDVAAAKAKGGGIADIEDPCQHSKKGLWLVEMGEHSEVYFKNVMFNKYLAVAVTNEEPFVTLQDQITRQCSWRLRYLDRTTKPECGRHGRVEPQ